ncbi:hypothetical protein NP233_g1562 [Leucocoprinus birnbaumii]|uniref:Uncharacterized protein n=1 Tax=Leucocoprinus birnbaumii TaxID=56174 RepID=A0AAD5W0Q0_9AGAR|nr:hypothetical protein NP233_g1562 [Leucocoprinus birnbaumii]
MQFLYSNQNERATKRRGIHSDDSGNNSPAHYDTPYGRPLTSGPPSTASSRSSSQAPAKPIPTAAPPATTPNIPTNSSDPADDLDHPYRHQYGHDTVISSFGDPSPDHIVVPDQEAMDYSDEGESDGELPIDLEQEESRKGKPLTSAEREQMIKINKLREKKATEKAQRCEAARQVRFTDSPGRVPDLWGITTVGGERERDNGLRNMLLHVFYHSPHSNCVYIGTMAQQARRFETSPSSGPYQPEPTSPIYRAAKRGLPRTIREAKSLISVLRNTGSQSRTSPSEHHRAEAFLLLDELFKIAQRVEPDHLDRVMAWLISDQGRFDPKRDRNLVDSRELERQLFYRDQSASTRWRGLKHPSMSDVMNIDQYAAYLIGQCHPGSPSYIPGVAINYMLQVYRPSVFGAALSQLLVICKDPAERTNFVRILAILAALPNKYRELIHEVTTRAQQTFTPRTHKFPIGIKPLMINPTNVRPYGFEFVVDVLMCNGISPEWIDHLYSWGILTLDYLFREELLPIEQLIEIDNERIERLTRFGIPNLCPQLPQGWRHPTKDDLLQIHLSFELLHSRSHQDPRKAPYWVKAGIAFPFRDLPHRRTTAIPSSTDSIPMDITADKTPADKTTSMNWANEVEAHLERTQPQDETPRARTSTAPPVDRPDSPTKATPAGSLSLTALKK